MIQNVTPLEEGYWYGMVFVPKGNVVRTAITPVGELPNVPPGTIFINRFPKIDADGRELWCIWVLMEALP